MVDVPGLEMRGLIGTGGNSWVYRAWWAEQDREVAVKVLRGGSDPVTAKRFEREVHAVSKLDNDAGVVPILHAGTTPGGDPYLLMPLFERGSLQDLIATGTPMDPEEAARLIATAADTLQRVHDRGVVHGDIKPANVLLDDDGEPVIADFGISRLTGSSQTYSGVMLTPTFSAPEAFDDGKPTPETDVYSLGATLYALLQGHPPFADAEGETRAATLLNRILHEPPPPVTAQPVPEQIALVLEAAMAKRPEERPATAAILAAQLRGSAPVTLARAVPAGITATTVGAAPGQDNDRRRRRGLLVAAAAVLVLLLGGGAALALGSDGGGDGGGDLVETAEGVSTTTGAADAADGEDADPDTTDPDTTDTEPGDGSSTTTEAGGGGGASPSPAPPGQPSPRPSTTLPGQTPGPTPGPSPSPSPSPSPGPGDPTPSTVTPTTRPGATTTTTTTNPADDATPASVPGAPRSVTATGGVEQITVSFSPPGSDGGAPITGYTATCSSTNGGAMRSAGGTSPITVGGATAGRSYSCSVRATNSSGTGPASGASNAVTVLAPAPPLTWVNQPSVSDVSTTSAMVVFRASQPTSHTITYQATDGSHSGQASQPNLFDAHNQQLSGLVAGKTYNFTVTARSASGATLTGSGSFTTATQSTTTRAPGLPINLDAYCARLGDGAYWIDVGGDPMTRYRCVFNGVESVADLNEACRLQHGSAYSAAPRDGRLVDCYR